MLMYYGGNLICSGEYQGKSWTHCKIMLSSDLQRVNVHKCRLDDNLMQTVAKLVPGQRCDVSFDFYGNVESVSFVEGGGNHV